MADHDMQSADGHYFSRLAQGVFEIPRCRECGRFHFFPRVLCPFCGSDALQWTAPSGYGRVYSTTVVRGKESSHNVCLVDLDEGPRLMSRVVGIEPDAVKIGARVKACIEPSEHTGQTGKSALLVFRPTGETP
ncbi:Zn-ribbon domain-containing OB-fold protein [Cupriavidus nantongensis]|uniref:Zn-ribbon domain-containing OB-fold protein n=1 Tax=Cupriavidus nantongensis TaxID=1796606 RepID=UPI002245CF9A|nr:OB-fold domain-containing protein [Cupriavidus nantongensis]